MVRILGKRGQDDKIYFLIWELIVLAMVIIALIVSVRGISNNTTYWKRYHSTDLALITDLTYAGQGDFVISYNMKELQQNFFTKMLLIDNLVFQTFMETGSITVYDQSQSDKFPETFVYGKSQGVTVTESNTTSSFITLYRIGGLLGIEGRYNLQIQSCPLINTQKDTSNLKFDVKALDSGAQRYADYSNNLLKTYSNASGSNEWIIFITSGDNTVQTAGAPVNPVNILYTSDLPSNGDKLSCLIEQLLKKTYPDKGFTKTIYDGSYDSDNEFTANKDKYTYWAIIKIPSADNIEPSNIATAIRDSFIQYYGQQNAR